MDKITLDPGMVEKSAVATVLEAELLAPDGRTVGYFLPPAAYTSMRKAFYEWANAQVTTDEIHRALANPKRHTMKEVWKLFEDT